jgi:PAS domain S-box-containing protein
MVERGDGYSQPAVPEGFRMTAVKKNPEDRSTDITEMVRTLRNDAEEQVARTSEKSSDLVGQPAENLIHELRVHQVELETQAEELRRVQLALVESRDKYLDLYDFAPLGYLTLNHDALIEEVNLTGATLLGVERANLVNTRFRKFIAPEYTDPWDRYFMNVLRGGQTHSCPLVLKRGDGSTFPARLESVPVTDRGNDSPTVRVTISDITYIRQAETALRISNKKLNLLSSITRHDILNELTVLSGSLELSLGKIKETERIEHIRRAQSAADRIRRQIAFTREYEDLGSKAPIWQPVPATVRAAASLLTTKTITFEIPEERLEIFADPLLAKVFFNLFDNARQHGGSVSRITLSYHPADNGLTIVVADNGTGVAPEQKTHLFDRGFGKNTGLGLFLSREILSITEITITENGIPGRGAQFEIFVPQGSFRFA